MYLTLIKNMCFSFVAKASFCHILCGCINSFKSQKKQQKKFNCRNNYRFSLVLKIQKKIKIYAKIKTFFWCFFFLINELEANQEAQH